MAGGAVLRKFGVIKREHDTGIMQLIFSVLLPCFILDRTLGSEVLRNWQVLATGTGLGFSLIVIGIGIGAFPLAIMMTGATIMDLVGTEKPSWKIVTAACVVRLAVMPVIIILCAKFIPMATELRQILLVQAAMPAALTPILLARLYGGRPSIAVQVVIATTVASIFTLPYIITFGIRYLNLSPLAP